jgi:hypothetical protein
VKNHTVRRFNSQVALAITLVLYPEFDETPQLIKYLRTQLVKNDLVMAEMAMQQCRRHYQKSADMGLHGG